MSDLDNVFFLRRVVIKKQRKTVGTAADGGYTLPASFLKGHPLWKSGTPRVNRAPFSLQPRAELRRESKGILCSALSRLRRFAKPHASLRKAGRKRSFSAHSHCGGRCLARFSLVSTAVAFLKMLLCGHSAGQPPAPPRR